jgi:hypothetical protein
VVGLYAGHKYSVRLGKPPNMLLTLKYLILQDIALIARLLYHTLLHLIVYIITRFLAFQLLFCTVQWYNAPIIASMHMQDRRGPIRV